MDQLLSLRVFTRIADAGTFVKAAESLKLPPSTVTKLIQDLESHLGVKLLHRTTRRVTVTPEGAAYYERAIRVISDVDDMDGFVANQRAQPKGPPASRCAIDSCQHDSASLPAHLPFPLSGDRDHSWGE